jgi:transcriptional regulator with XRE-family HTH domain
MVKDLKKLFGARLVALRRERHLKAREVAEYVGITASWMSHLEHGRYETSFGELPNFAEALGVDELDLFCFPGANVRHEINELSRRASLSVNLQTLEHMKHLLAEEEKKLRAAARRKR